MPLPNNPNVAKIALVGHRDVRQWVNTFHVHKLGGGAVTLADLLALAPAYKAAWDAAYKTFLNGPMGLDVIQLRVLDPSNPIALDYTTGLPSFGTTGATMEAANVTLSVSWRTGLAGRKYRGRFYVAGIQEGHVSTIDQLTTAGMSVMLALADYLYNAPSVAGGFDPVIFHKADNTFTTITSYVVESIIDSQRRRLPARGR